MSRPPPTSSASIGSAAGFSLVELIVVLVILGVLSAVAIPRFFGAAPYRASGFLDESLAAARYAHKVAIGSGCDIKLAFTAGGLSVERWAACTPASHAAASSPVPHPGGHPFTGTAPAGVSVAATALYFDAAGRPRDLTGALIAGNTDIAIGGRTLRIVGETGLAYRP